ncbi:MAG: hypothetical protein II010_05345, partial [Oscillospiraceae bacterium]|nr:hypothetical protein [Oscillospiraceae bacterium]
HSHILYNSLTIRKKMSAIVTSASRDTAEREGIPMKTAIKILVALSLCAAAFFALRWYLNRDK